MRMKPSFLLICVGAMLPLFLNGCASSRGGDVYSRDQARQAQDVRFGRVESVRPVLIEGTEGVIGSVTGAAIGGIAGSTIGGGTGSDMAAVAGVLIGGLIGAALEEGVTRREALEVTVQLDNGQVIAVVQEANDYEFFPQGARVRVLTDYNGVSRVVGLTGGVVPQNAPRPSAQPMPAY